jgi:serine protease AprX
VITVGALTDAHTPADWSDDTIPTFSAAGPTIEAFVKPDLVAPGGRLVGLMPPTSKLAREHPESRLTKNYYRMSGTSMSAAQVSGVVALMLAQSPELRPDQVKYRLMASARQARAADGTLAYSVWQQGAGRVDAYRAVYGGSVGRANRGLDVAADLGLAGVPRHYVGHTRWDAENEQFYLQDAEDHVWGGTMADIDAAAGGAGFVWSEALSQGAGVLSSELLANGHASAKGVGFVWSEALPWGEAFGQRAGLVWSKGFVRSEGFVWSDVAANLVTWVACDEPS